ncbi:MAG: aspartate carbamoyltransferase regulatory subunit, partial [Oscillospiraceae bacterium]
VNIVKDGKIVEKSHLALPERVTGVIKCKNPRCITSTEQELPHVFQLVDRDTGLYRCVYCETKAER